MEIIGYIASIFIGISLGLIGGGGSILTVPVLVYLFGIGAEMSTAYSLFIVGSTALVGGIRNASLGNVNYKTAVVFTIPAFIAVYVTRAYLVPAIPFWPNSCVNFPEATSGIGVLIILIAPPLVLGPWLIEDGPFRTSTELILPVVGK